MSESFGAETARLRHEWLGRQLPLPGVPPRPAPEVACRVAGASEVPGGARRLQLAAERAGWTVQVTYARGTRDGRPPKVVDSVAVRLGRQGVRAYAVWVDGKVESAAVRSNEAGHLLCGVMVLKRIIEEPERIVEIVAETREAKLRAGRMRVTVMKTKHTKPSGRGRVHA